MKEIKTIRTKTIEEEVISYEAIDGKVFYDEEECKKYEESAICVMLAELNKYLIRTEADGKTKIINRAYCRTCYVNEDDMYAVYKLEDKDAIRAFGMVQKYYEGKISDKLDSYIGKEVLVYIGYNGEDRLWIAGTEEELREYYNKYLDDIFRPTPKEDKE